MVTNDYAASIAITDTAIKRQLLWYLMEQGEALPSELMAFCDELRRRPLNDFLALTQAKTLRLSLSLANVAQGLMNLDAFNNEAALLQYFVDNGASKRMLHTYFSLSLDKSAKLSQAPAGKVRLPSVEIRDRIHFAWYRLEKQLPGAAMRDKLYELHQLFPFLTFRVLEAVLQEDC